VIDSDFLQIFLTFAFHYDVSKYRRQLNDNDRIVKLVQKILFGNYEPIMRICEKIFIINLHNLQMLFN